VDCYRDASQGVPGEHGSTLAAAAAAAGNVMSLFICLFIYMPKCEVHNINRVTLM